MIFLSLLSSVISSDIVKFIHCIADVRHIHFPLQRVKSPDANEADTTVCTDFNKLNGNESSNDPLVSMTNPSMEELSYNGAGSQVTYCVLYLDVSIW